MNLPEKPFPDYEIPSDIFDDEDREELDEARIEQILNLLHECPEYMYWDAKELIDEGVFYTLDFKPSRGEVEEAQGRELGGHDW